MSEKIYAFLLRLYPSAFRQAYGEEALQLFRDRCRHERGFFRIVRLWLDLLADLLHSLPRVYQNAPPALMPAAVDRYSEGAPSFQILESKSPRLIALLLGGLLSLALAGASIPIGHMVNRRSGTILWRARSIEQTDPADRPAKPLPSQQQSQEIPHMIFQPATAFKSDNTERKQVIQAVIKKINEHYVDPVAARKIEDSLVAHQRAGDYEAIEDDAAFAALLTQQLREVSHDTHLELVYSRNPLPHSPTGPTPERIAQYRNALEANNCTFEKIEILPRNIGYLKINSFPDPSICETTAREAMASLNQTDAIIFDLRDNRGGYPTMVTLIAAYLFDHPEYMYNPRETTERSWTQSPVPGSRLVDKPAFILTSSRTFSGAEHFSYDLKMLKRATLVGEKTAGATDVGNFHRIDDHFGVGIREIKTINPYSEPDWAATGVKPDVEVPAADALAAAEKLARIKFRQK